MTGETEPVPLAIRTSDLPVRAASALVMVAVAGVALWLGGVWLDGFIVAVALAAFGEFARLIFRALTSISARIVSLIAGIGYFALAASILIGQPPRTVLIISGTVVFIDTFAYFFGRSIGGPKIAPKISPSKTWAGLAGGVVGATLWLAATLLIFMADGSLPLAEIAGSPKFWAVLVLFGALYAVAAQSGDFFESWLKRKAGVKDSSNLIPGHGGIFDRVDGLLPVALIWGLGTYFVS